MYWILFSFKMDSIFASPKDFLMQPQDNVDPFFKFVVNTLEVFPHSH